MTRPAYFLIEKIDLTGSSTGYHRAAIIDAAIKHFDEWWLTGTDYTRDWMPYGLSSMPNHIDITNHYLLCGVEGGIFLVLIFVFEIGIAFRYVGQSLRQTPEAKRSDHFLIWSIGAGLFAHAVTMISVAYFDQSVIFLYFYLAVIGSIYANTLTLSLNRTINADAPPTPFMSDPTFHPNHRHESATAIANLNYVY
jgi:hypothetical protein